MRKFNLFDKTFDYKHKNKRKQSAIYSIHSSFRARRIINNFNKTFYKKKKLFFFFNRLSRYSYCASHSCVVSFIYKQSKFFFFSTLPVHDVHGGGTHKILYNSYHLCARALVYHIISHTKRTSLFIYE